jgi:hypothetical protein
VIAAVLHLHEGACAALERVDEVRRVLAHTHYVGDAHLFGPAEAEIL